MRFTIALLAVLALSAGNGVLAGHKRKAPVVKTLCPLDETACPIKGSTTFEAALKHHTLTKGEVSGVMAGSGGYECVDTRNALDSCGGCASTSEGIDCTTIRASKGVACSEGRCLVLSCRDGWKPNLKAEKCVRTRASHSSSTSKHGIKRSASRIAFETKKPSTGFVLDSSS